MNTHGQQSTHFSPTNASKPMTLIKDDETVNLINLLSSSIKTYYRSTKLSLSDLKKLIPSIDNSPIEQLDLDLLSFIKEAKSIFQNLKLLRNKTKINFEPLFSQNPSRPSSHSKQRQSPQKSLIALSPQLGRTTLFSDKKNLLTIQSGEQLIRNMNNDSEIVLSLANKVIQFLSQLLQIEESVLKRSNDIDIKRSTFDFLKNDLMYLAQEILDKSTLNNYNHNNANHNLDHNEGLMPIDEGIAGKQISVKTLEKNDNTPLIMNKMKCNIIALQKEIKDLQQKNSELKELLNIKPGNHSIINKSQTYEAEINRLKEIKSKCNSEKIQSTDDARSRFKTRTTNVINANKSSLKDYIQVNEQKEKLISVLKHDINNVLDKRANQDNNTKKQPRENNKSKGKSVRHYEASGLSKTYTNNNFSTSQSPQGEESFENLNKKIIRLTNEIKARNKELNDLKEEDAQKDAVVASCIKELTDIKEIYENENGNLRDELNDKQHENELLTNELKILNDQIAKINIPPPIHKTGKQSPLSYNAIMAKNTIEYKKIHDELFKERKEKNELLNHKKLFNQEVIKLGMELQVKNDEIKVYREKLLKTEEEIKQLTKNNNDDNDHVQTYDRQLSPGKTSNNNNESSSSSVINNIKFNSEEIANKNIQLESLSNQYVALKEQFNNCVNECNMLKSTCQSLNDKIISKEKLFVELKEKNDAGEEAYLKKYQEDLTNVIIAKNAEVTAARKKVEDLLESQNIIRGITKNKDSIIQELNDKIAKVTESKLKAMSDKEKVVEYYENKLKELSPLQSNRSAPKDEDLLSNPLYITLQNKLKTLQSDYDMKCSTLTNKNKQIDLISTQNNDNEKELQTLKITMSEKDEQIATLIKKAEENISIKPIEATTPLFSHETHNIIVDKKYHGLHWYLISLQDESIISYDNTFWVEEAKISNELNQYNKFQSEEEKEIEAINQINTIKSKMIKQLEDKEDEIMKLTCENKKLIDQISNGNLTGSLNQKPKSNLKALNLLSSSMINNPDGNDNSIPMEKYEKSISEVNDLNNRLNKANAFIAKLQNENKELSKNIDNRSNNQNEQGLSFINNNNKTTSFVDDEIKDVLEMGSERIQNGEGVDNTELKTLLKILLHEMSDTSKIKLKGKLGDICKLVGFSVEETVKMVGEKNKKGGLMNFLKKK